VDFPAYLARKNHRSKHGSWSEFCPLLRNPFIESFISLQNLWATVGPHVWGIVLDLFAHMDAGDLLYSQKFASSGFGLKIHLIEKHQGGQNDKNMEPIWGNENFSFVTKSVQVQVLQPKQILRWFHPSLEIPKNLPHQRTNYCFHWLIVVSGKRSSTKTCLLFQDLFNSK